MMEMLQSLFAYDFMKHAFLAVLIKMCIRDRFIPDY